MLVGWTPASLFGMCHPLFNTLLEIHARPAGVHTNVVMDAKPCSGSWVVYSPATFSSASPTDTEYNLFRQLPSEENKGPA